MDWLHHHEVNLVERHLLECEQCHDFYAGLKRLEEAVSAVPVQLFSNPADQAAAYSDFLTRLNQARTNNSNRFGLKRSLNPGKPRLKKEGPRMRLLQSFVKTAKGKNNKSGLENISQSQSQDKFTRRAQRVLLLAQAAAFNLNHPYIGTEHLLLGLLEDTEGIACKVLTKLGLSLETARLHLTKIVGDNSGQLPPGQTELRFTPRTKKVIELGVEEARQNNHEFVGTEHLLLGILREGEGIGADILSQQNITYLRVKEEILAYLEAD